jgi:hypothetical protein
MEKRTADRENMAGGESTFKSRIDKKPMIR